MKQKVETVLLVILGLLVGLLIHGLIEIPAIWILTGCLSSFFLKVSWDNWLLIHLIFSVVVEILGLILVFWIAQKYKRK